MEEQEALSDSHDHVVVCLKHGGEAHDLTLGSHATLQDLQMKIEDVTGVLIRQQKLLWRGKTIASGNNTTKSTLLSSIGLKNRAKVMLISSSHTSGKTLCASMMKSKINTKNNERMQSQARPRTSNSSMESRSTMWFKTGIVSLRDLKLHALPNEVFAECCQNSVRIADMGGNCLSSLSPRIAELTRLQKLRLSSNALTDDGIPWDALTSLPNLSVLSLESNALTYIPESISRLTTLEVLRLGNNMLIQLPERGMGSLIGLRVLDVRRNKLKTLPHTLSRCSCIEEIDASINELRDIPPEFGELKNLRVLLLDRNRIDAVPMEVLRGCANLCTLSLKENPITMDELQNMPGFNEFEQRRQRKYDKKIDMKVLLDRDGFEEAADKAGWEKFKG